MRGILVTLVAREWGSSRRAVSEGQALSKRSIDGWLR